MARQLLLRLVTTAVAAALIATVASTGVAVAKPEGAQTLSAASTLAPREWTRAQDATPKYPGVAVQWSVPVRMSDGTVLKADIYRPAGADGKAVKEKMPSVVMVFAYHKLLTALLDIGLNIPVLSPLVLAFANALNFTGTPLTNMRQFQNVISGGGLSALGVDRKLVQSGYTQVVVDARGTGSSQGKWQVLDTLEQRDTLEVLEWTRKQSWSNGILGMNGASYSAITQLQAASKNPEGLKAIFPLIPSTDPLRDVVAPGAGLGVGFVGMWLGIVNSQNKIPDLQGLIARGDIDLKWLSDRVKDPAVFMQYILEAMFAPSIDSLSPGAKTVLQQDSEFRKAILTDTKSIRVPTMVVGGWRDIFTTTEWQTLNNLTQLPATQKKLVMGDTFHVTFSSDMGKRSQPPRVDVLQRTWFDKWLKGIDNKVDQYQPATIHQRGGGWIQASTFPRPGHESRRLYLSGQRSGTSPTSVRDGSLQGTAPTSSADWTVSPGVASVCSGDTAQDLMGIPALMPFCSDDNRLAETNALTFTSKPARSGTSISGPINLHLRTKVDAKDGFYSVVVTDVAPDGQSKILSSGSMTTSIKNQLVPEKSLTAPNGDITYPYYALDITTRKTVTPGTVSTLEIGTNGIDAYIRPGHRIRVSVYSMNFPKAISLGPVRVDSGLKPQHILIDPSNPSWLSLPTNRPLGT